MSSLAEPVTIGRMVAPHRIAMAPMTRHRADPRGVPTHLMVRYYAQRADAAFIVTEGTLIDFPPQLLSVPQPRSAAGAIGTSPGLVTDAQEAGWRSVVDAVHVLHGRIVVQLWLAGRLAHHPHELPVSEFDLTPDSMSRAEFAQVVDRYQAAAARAAAAGFDAVEIHAGTGSLLDEFFRTSVNHRDDAYGGGDVVGRTRLALEAVDAVAAEVGADRTGVRVAPHLASRAVACPFIVDTVEHLAARLDERGVAYLHVAESDWAEVPEPDAGFHERLRAAFGGTVVAAGEYTLAKALRAVGDGLVDVVAFGRAFVANPDLPTRLIAGLPLAEPDLTSLYSGGAKGYTTYPRWGADVPGSPAGGTAGHARVRTR